MDVPPRTRACWSNLEQSCKLVEKTDPGSVRIASAMGVRKIWLAREDLPRILCRGRWACTKSVLRYVKTPEYIRNMDAADMLAASMEHPWNHVLAARRQASGIEDELWCAKQMTFARHQF